MLERKHAIRYTCLNARAGKMLFGLPLFNSIEITIVVLFSKDAGDSPAYGNKEGFRI